MTRLRVRQPIQALDAELMLDCAERAAAPQGREQEKGDGPADERAHDKDGT